MPTRNAQVSFVLCANFWVVELFLYNGDTNVSTRPTIDAMRVHRTADTENISSIISATIFDELEQFVSEFRQRRIDLGYTQEEVGWSISNSSTYSQTTISRFENRLLSLKNMCRLKNMLDEWLKNADSSPNRAALIPPQFYIRQNKTRRRRTTIKEHIKQQMEQHFAIEHMPSSTTLAHLSDEWKLDYEVVRVWFCNRRRKLRRDSGDLKVLLPEPVFLDPKQAPVSTTDSAN
uniref:POU domain protein n=1 Tax=Angiostrongylus cantonensis TaxID=6313 RepID=A0A158P6V9_ANGCA